MKKNEWLYGIAFEILWLSFAFVLSFVVLSMVRTSISKHFYWYLFGAMFLMVTYFRLIIWARTSILIRSIWIKLLLCILNIPLFFFMLHYYGNFMMAFDDYIYDLPETTFQHIHSYTDIDQILMITRLTIISGVGSLCTIVLLELRLIYLVFKLRQLDPVIDRLRKR